MKNRPNFSIPQHRVKDVINKVCSMPEGKDRVKKAVVELEIRTLEIKETASIIKSIIVDNPTIWTKICDGDIKLIGFLIGKLRKKEPNIDPSLAKEIFQILSSEKFLYKDEHN